MAVAGLSATVYLDHNVDPQIADDLREHGYGAVARARGRHGRGDG